MKKIVTVFIKILSLLILIAAIAAVICFKPLDVTPYKQTDYYKKELEEIKNLVSETEDSVSAGALEIGWSRVNLLPPFTTPIAIDAHRGGKHFEGVHDSIYVRAIVFKQGSKKIAYVSADMLIIPPVVSKTFDSLLTKHGFDQSNIYFTATHTHTSIGAWHNSYVGEIFAGKYDERVPKHIADCIAKAILEAEQNCGPAKIGYAEFPTHKLVFNRLVKDQGKVDSMLRIVKIEKTTGQKAAIITFSAHCTVFHKNLMNLSGDWAGLMMTQLNNSGKMDFACFSAGEVGSHGPFEVTKDQEKEAEYMADNVAKIVEENFDSIPTHLIMHIKMIHLPFYLREPEDRISATIAVRPWLFRKLFGDEKVYLNTFQLGNLIFVGTPCDFSGELIGPIDSVAGKSNEKVIITSFNGGYIGYVTDDKWYKLNTYETRTMGWFGPGNGDYMSEIMERLIDKSDSIRAGN